MVLFSFLVNTLIILLWMVALALLSFIYFYKVIESSVTRVQYLPRADLGQTCPDMTTRAHTCTHMQSLSLG